MGMFRYDLCGRSCTTKGILRSHIARVKGGLHASMSTTSCPSSAIGGNIPAHDGTRTDIYENEDACFTNPLITFTSNTVCHGVFCFYETFGDTTAPIFNTRPKSTEPITQLSPTCRICVLHPCFNNFSSQSSKRYYDHTERNHRIGGTSKYTGFTCTFLTPSLFRKYCDNFRRLGVV